jgi:NTE family protein
MNNKKALVLSGGSVKGAFQAGALKAVLESGYAPEIITGISVGSLNGTFIANEAGKLLKGDPGGKIDWPGIGQYLYDFWKENITGPASIVRKRSKLSLFLQVALNKFKGATDSKPIDTLIDRIISMENLNSSGIFLAVGAVNMVSGKILYVEGKNPDFLDYLKASKAIPVVMPHININNEPYLDGGLRDSAPLRIAIQDEATEIICILCHSRDLEEEWFNPCNIMELGDRISSIHSNETVNNDIEYAEYCNRFLPEDGSPKQDEPFRGYRKLKITTIRPDKEIELNLENFTSSDIVRVMDSGYKTAKDILDAKSG